LMSTKARVRRFGGASARGEHMSDVADRRRARDGFKMAEKGGFEPRKIAMKSTGIRRLTHKETHKTQSL
jgi:hypothetical protein